MEGKLCKISSYLNQDEMRMFRQMVKARDLTESMFIREMLGFDVRPRGAPKGARKKKAPQEATRKKKESRSGATGTRASQLSLLD